MNHDSSPAGPSARRIVLMAVGSYGDVHPYIAIALGLKARGHNAVVATCACYRKKVESLGLGYRTVRPDCDRVDDPSFMTRYMDPRRGTFRVLRELFLPALRDSYEDAMAAAEGADLLVSHTIFYATRLVAATTGIPWVSTAITPSALYSAYDPPLFPGRPAISRLLRPLGPRFWKGAWSLAGRATRHWAEPIRRLEAELGVTPVKHHPLVDAHSPGLVLALFSGVLAAKQPDWPPQVAVTGFPFYDRRDGEDPGLPAELARFLDDGPPPIVFTLGMSSANVAGRFFEDSLAAAGSIGMRAVLLGKRHGHVEPADPAKAIWCEYAPFSLLFPRAAMVVHGGGIGTTGLSMRAGRPMLVVPFSHDQPDNADRLRRLGVARVLPGPRYDARRAAAALRMLRDDPSYARRAAEVGERVGREDGVAAACDAIEGLLRPGRDGNGAGPPRRGCP
ncbi:MurG-like transferase [Aquisphaera giovannonii]|uniref:MurG-like transferase n=1 Tax=Aquisphaera giovannonii TaxID=406548 RepID=A0A5B9W2M8_9BACT|nr:glycosyltransferase [Aquisphaera giovannonii]QEH34846.1 MurG-like transferase [Aquisphaera giovannonii]